MVPVLTFVTMSWLGLPLRDAMKPTCKTEETHCQPLIKVAKTRLDSQFGHWGIGIHGRGRGRSSWKRQPGTVTYPTGIPLFQDSLEVGNVRLLRLERRLRDNGPTERRGSNGQLSLDAGEDKLLAQSLERGKGLWGGSGYQSPPKPYGAGARDGAARNARDVKS